LIVHEDDGVARQVALLARTMHCEEGALMMLRSKRIAA